jgi:hypothetical protein
MGHIRYFIGTLPSGRIDPAGRSEGAVEKPKKLPDVAEAAERVDREIDSLRQCTRGFIEAMQTALSAISNEEAERAALEERKRATLH